MDFEFISALSCTYLFLVHHERPAKEENTNRKNDWTDDRIGENLKEESSFENLSKTSCSYFCEKDELTITITNNCDGNSQPY